MRYFLTLCRFVLAVVITSALVGPAAAAGQPRPFKGSLNGQFVTAPTDDPTVFLSEARARGNGTHVGRFTKVTSDALNVVTGEVTGAFTMTAANGDLLTGNYTGFAVLETATTFSWSLNATITGGTGRFENATGEFVFVAGGEFVVVGGTLYGTYTETFDGTISY